jgi:hypothetical protein
VCLRNGFPNQGRVFIVAITEGSGLASMGPNALRIRRRCGLVHHRTILVIL